jgi:hypothetical protein
MPCNGGVTFFRTTLLVLESGNPSRCYELDVMRNTVEDQSRIDTYINRAPHAYHSFPKMCIYLLRTCECIYSFMRRLSKSQTYPHSFGELFS